MTLYLIPRYRTQVSSNVNALESSPKATSERAEQTRRRIVESATTLFDTPGNTATTMEAIASEEDAAVGDGVQPVSQQGQSA